MRDDEKLARRRQRSDETLAEKQVRALHRDRSSVIVGFHVDGACESCGRVRCNCPFVVDDVESTCEREDRHAEADVQEVMSDPRPLHSHGRYLARHDDGIGQGDT